VILPVSSCSVAAMKLAFVALSALAGTDAAKVSARSSMLPRGKSGLMEVDSDKDPSLPSFYHSSQEIHDELQALSETCQGMTLSSDSQTNFLGDRAITIDTVKIRAEGEQPRNKVFILFGEHARELISAESGLHFVRKLCSGDARAQKALQNNEFMMVINGNPESRRKVEKGDWCVRMNPNNVDLNRNWDEHWEESPDMDDTNSGTRPFSEPETQIFKRLVSDYKPTTFLTIHSGTLGMYMPWAFDMEHLADRNQKEMMQILTEVDKDHCECPFGAAGKEVGYSCPGTCLDYVFDKLKTPYAFAYEIYVGQGRQELKDRWNEKMKSPEVAYVQANSHLAESHFKDIFEDYPSSFVQVNATHGSEQLMSWNCFALYNPGTEDEYQQTVENWALAYLDTADKVAEKIAM